MVLQQAVHKIHLLITALPLLHFQGLLFHVVRDKPGQAPHYHTSGLYVRVFISVLTLGCSQDNKIMF